MNLPDQAPSRPLSSDIQQILDDRLRPYSASVSQRPPRLSESQVREISALLHRAGRESWSRVPRLYALLHMIGCVDTIDAFISERISDLYIPFSFDTLPNILRDPDIRANFVRLQDSVLTKGTDLETENGRHRHFSNSNDITLRKIGELGQGGFSSVDRVLSTITFNEYARKLISRGRTFNRNIEVLKKFERELQNLKKVTHIHIVKLVGSYTDPTHVGILILPIADCNLAVFLARGLNGNEMSLLRNFYGCLASALCYLHQNRFRHKDIKPQNVLVKGHEVFLTDFGLSLDCSELEHSTTEGSTEKTRRYCAPEVGDNKKRSYPADIWSLGCVFLEIWTVLMGYNVSDLLSYLDTHGSRDTCYYRNLDSVRSWCNEIQGRPPIPEETIPTPWIYGCLEPDPEKRWPAHQLRESIEANSCRYAFIGSCCTENSDEYVDSIFSDLSIQPTSETPDETHMQIANVETPINDLAVRRSEDAQISPILSALGPTVSNVSAIPVHVQGDRSSSRPTVSYVVSSESVAAANIQTLSQEQQGLPEGFATTVSPHMSSLLASNVPVFHNSLIDGSLALGPFESSGPRPHIEANQQVQSRQRFGLPFSRCDRPGCQQRIPGVPKRAFGQKYHPQCFRCKVCDQVLRGLYYPVTEQLVYNPAGPRALCIDDTLRQVGCICHVCDEVIGAFYVKAGGNRYHIEHFDCDECGLNLCQPHPQEYYESSGKILCQYHYCADRATRCMGCKTPILGSLVCVSTQDRDPISSATSRFHVQCYLVDDAYNTRMASISNRAYELSEDPENHFYQFPNSEERQAKEKMYQVINSATHRVWSTLSNFDRATTSIVNEILRCWLSSRVSDILQAFAAIIVHAKKILDALDSVNDRLSRSRVPGVLDAPTWSTACKLCETIISLMQEYTATRLEDQLVADHAERALEHTRSIQAHLKLLVTTGIKQSLQFMRTKATTTFLNRMEQHNEKYHPAYICVEGRLEAPQEELCKSCHQTIIGTCLLNDTHVWHPRCLPCMACGGLRQAMSPNTPKLPLRYPCGHALPPDFIIVPALQQLQSSLDVAFARIMDLGHPISSGIRLKPKTRDPSESAEDILKAVILPRMGNSMRLLSPPGNIATICSVIEKFGQSS